MILGKSNLYVYLCTSDDKGINILNNVHISKDGETIAVDNKIMVLISALPSDITKHFLIKSNILLPEKGISIYSENIKELIRNVPTDKTFGGLLEQVCITGLTDESVTFSITDGRKKTNFEFPIHRQKFVEYKNEFETALNGKKIFKLCLNRKTLMRLLEIINHACDDLSGKSPVYIEGVETGEIIIRARNDRTLQVATGIMGQYETEGGWIDGEQHKRKKRKTRRKNNHN